MKKDSKSGKIDKKSKFSANINMNYFKQSFWQRFDKNFLLILLVTIVVEMIFVSILAMKPVEQYSEKEIKKIQQQFASFILEKEPMKDEGAVTFGSGSGSEGQAEETASEESASEGAGEEGAGSGGSEGTGSPGESSTSARATSSAEARRKARSEVSRKVRSKGLLGILTSSDRTSAGDGAVSIFEGGYGENNDEDLDNLLSSVDGLQTLKGSAEEGSGAEGGGYGKRTGGQAAIDDLLSQDQGVSSELMSREGALTIEASQEEGEKDSGMNQYRNAQAIQQVLLSHNQVIKYCYERELRRYPSLKGKVVVRITVNPQGEVVDVSILSSTLNNERVERCIVARISQWKDFRSVDPKAGNVTFRQTYVFGY